MQTQIKFLVGGANSMHGGFSSGDLMRCDQAMADHYVKEGIAEYVKVPPAKSAEIAEAPDLAKAAAPAKPIKAKK